MADYQDIFDYTPEDQKPIRINDHRWPDETRRTKEKVYTQDYNPDLVHEELLDGSTDTTDLNPKNPRRRYHHSTGTGWEILKDGSLYRHHNGNTHEYYKEGLNTTVQGNVDYKVGGHSRTSISGGSHDEVKGDRSTFTAGSAASYTAGNHTMAVGAGPGNQGGALTLAAEKSITLGGATTGNKSQSPIRLSIGKDGTMYITTSQHVNIKASADIMFTADGNIGMQCKGNFSVAAQGNIDMKGSGGHVNIESGGAGNFLAGGVMKISGGALKMAPLIADVEPGFNIVSQAAADSASPQVSDYSPGEKPAVSTTAPTDTVAT